MQEYVRLSDIITVHILPPLTTLPPETVKTTPRIEAVIGELFDSTDFLQKLGSCEITAVQVHAGRFCGQKPIDVLTRRLEETGCNVTENRLQSGRAHRIQDYTLVLQR